MQEYVAVMGEPGALTAALNWYRASDCHARALHDDTFEFGEVDTPTLLLWGKDDRAIRRMAVDLGAEHMAGPYRVVELDAGHFLVDDVPERVADEVLDHLRRHPL